MEIGSGIEWGWAGLGWDRLGHAGLRVSGSLSSPRRGRKGRSPMQERGCTSQQTAMVGGQQGTLGTPGTPCWREGALGKGLYLMTGSHVLSPSRGPCGFAEVFPPA